MEQRIIDALILKLNSLFPDIKAYDVKMDMEIEPPMFQITCYERQRRDRITPAGFFYTYFFDLIFFSGHDEPEEKYRDIELELTNAVWHFEDFRGDDIRSTTVDDVLHVFFSITVELKEELPELPKIERINTEVNANERKISSQTIKGTS